MSCTEKLGWSELSLNNAILFVGVSYSWRWGGGAQGSSVGGHMACFGLLAAKWGINK